ncbi:hypothetical protein [Candidatus Poriferisodalis sp.]|uniref:hypothetical protein n=1 Tax=Candidatus Poriferisodalis sp. TaxID=3101277 RepID=UPI003B01F0D5
MVRRTLDRPRSGRASGPELSAEVSASIAAEEYLQACARNGVNPNGGPHSAAELAQQAEALRAQW